jgi:hypothetical protein
VRDRCEGAARRAQGQGAQVAGLSAITLVPWTLPRVPARGETIGVRGGGVPVRGMRQIQLGAVVWDGESASSNGLRERRGEIPAGRSPRGAVPDRARGALSVTR